MKIFNPLLLGALLISASAHAQPAAANSAASLSFKKINLSAGSKYKVENVMKSTNTMEMMGQSMEITADVNLHSQVDVAEKTAEGYKLVTKVTRMVTAANMMGQTVNYDSDKPEDRESEIGKLMSDKINQPSNATLTPEGKVTVQKSDNASAAAAANPMMAMMGGGEDETNGLGDLFLPLPENCKAGDSWMDSIISNGTKTYRNFTVKSVNGTDALISFTGTQSISKTVENQGMEANVNLENKMNGEITSDTGTGLIRQRTLTMEGTGSTEVMGQSIPMNTKVTVQSSVTAL